MARSFNGTSDLISTAATSGPSISTPFTVAAWIFANSIGVDQSIIGSIDIGGNTGGVQLRISSGGALQLNDNNHAVLLSGLGTSVRTQTWALVAGSYDGTNVNIYWNNTNASGTSAAGLGVAAHGYMIGACTDINNVAIQFWPGQIADVAFWSAILTAQEISALVAGARPYSVRGKSITAWWPLTGLQSPEPDFSGNKNNGTLTGTTPAFGPPIMQFTPRWPQSLLVSAGPTIILPFDVNMGQGYRQTRVVAY